MFHSSSSSSSVASKRLYQTPRVYYRSVAGIPAGPNAASEEWKNKEAGITAPKHWGKAGDVDRELATSLAQRG